MAEGGDFSIIADILDRGDGVAVDQRGFLEHLEQGKIARFKGIRFLEEDFVGTVEINGSQEYLLKKAGEMRVYFYIDSFGKNPVLRCMIGRGKNFSYGEREIKKPLDINDLGLVIIDTANPVFKPQFC